MQLYTECKAHSIFGEKTCKKSIGIILDEQSQKVQFFFSELTILQTKRNKLGHLARGKIEIKPNKMHAINARGKWIGSWWWRARYDQWYHFIQNI